MLESKQPAAMTTIMDGFPDGADQWPMAANSTAALCEVTNAHNKGISEQTKPGNRNRNRNRNRKDAKNVFSIELLAVEDSPGEWFKIFTMVTHGGYEPFHYFWTQMMDNRMDFEDGDKLLHGLDSQGVFVSTFGHCYDPRGPVRAYVTCRIDDRTVGDGSGTSLVNTPVPISPPCFLTGKLRQRLELDILIQVLLPETSPGMPSPLGPVHASVLGR